MKPFALSFDYTPKWKGNRGREETDRITVRLRDFPHSKQLALSEKLTSEFNSIDFAGSDETAKAKTISQSLITLKKNNLDISLGLVKKQFVSVSNLVVEREDGKEVKVETADQLVEYCEELAMELAARLVNGADADEIKN